jgi:hypothetical protein
MYFRLKFHSMNKLISLLLFIGLIDTFLAQTTPEFEKFSGKLVYSITITDTSLQKMIPPRQMVVYTNDTLIRIENSTDQLGLQVIIKHLVYNKSYLLLRTPVNNYAIQTDHNDGKEIKYPYSFKSKRGKRKILGMKAKRLWVSHENFKEPLEFLYVPQFSPKYINTLENFPGLPVLYFISSVDGTYEYRLISMEANTPNHDLFGVPSDYKRVTFDDFLNETLQYQQQSEGMEIEHE